VNSTEIGRLLPGIFQRTVVPGNPLAALLEVMADLHTSNEEVLANLDAYFDPYRAPDAFIPYLAGWVDLERIVLEAPEEFTGATPPPFPSGWGRLRELVAAAAFLATWRGTARGLLHFLVTATGVPGFTIDEQVPGPDGQPQPYYLRIHAPKAAAPYADLIRRIIELEKPAYVRYELQIEQ
jgi:phage tail-like protein